MKREFVVGSFFWEINDLFIFVIFNIFSILDIKNTYFQHFVRNKYFELLLLLDYQSKKLVNQKIKKLIIQLFKNQTQK